MRHAALDLPDPETPVGARGVGEPPVGAGYGAVLNAIADAIGDDVFRRAPVTPDVVLTSLEAGHRAHDVLTAVHLVGPAAALPPSRYCAPASLAVARASDSRAEAGRAALRSARGQPWRAALRLCRGGHRDGVPPCLPSSFERRLERRSPASRPVPCPSSAGR